MSQRRDSASGLRRRVVVAFGAFGLLLSLLFAGLVWGAAHFSEDRMVIRYLELELERFLDARDADPAATPPATRWLQATDDFEALPAGLHQFAREGDGAYELAAIEGAWGDQPENEYFLLVHTPEAGERLYLYVDADEMEVFDQHLAFLGSTLLLAILGVTGLGILLGRMTAHRVIAPVVELADRVSGLEHEPDGVISSDGFADDEVGLLARALEASTERSRAFLERERRFTRDASHELRSPVTVVRGAAELLSGLPEAESPRVRRPLDRIRRAADDMSRLIDAFLWLAREEELSAKSELRSLERTAAEAVERHRHLLDGKPVELELEVEPDAEVRAPEGVLGIVLGNLLANACFFTQEGRIRIHGDATALHVDDAGPGIPEERRQEVLAPHEHDPASRGFGLGLAIVRDLCERFGWRLELGDAPATGSEPPRGTRATVRFPGP